jgi:predicted Zn-dependent protease
MSYGREDEIASDALGIRIMAEAGYDPRAMIRVMEVDAIAKRFPQGLPKGLGE